MPGSHLAFCSSVPNMTRPWLPMPTLVPKAERKAGRGAAKLDGHAALVLHGKAQPAVFLGDREAEQPELAHLVDHVVGDGVVLGDLGLQRAQPLGDEAAHGLDELNAGVDVEGHGLFPAARLCRRRSLRPAAEREQTWADGDDRHLEGSS